jgi:hypothetical protein
MADTQRTIAQILALLADNNSGDISAQDIRDAFTTWRMGHGQIYIPDPGGATGTIDNTTNWFEATFTTWINDSAVAYLFDMSQGNGKLTYTGAVPVFAHLAFSFTTTVSGSNKKIGYRIGVNGTSNAASEIQRYVATGSDVGAGACHVIAALNPNDYISIFVRNFSSATSVNLNTANLQAVVMPA